MVSCGALQLRRASGVLLTEAHLFADCILVTSGIGLLNRISIIRI